MPKVKIEIQAEPRQFEVANYLLKQAVISLSGKENAEKLKSFGLSAAELKKCEAFRKIIVESFIENSKIPDSI